MNELVPELRRVAEWLRSWDPDEGRIHVAAADRIEALEARVTELAAALSLAIDTIEGLAEQQEMTNLWYQAPLDAARAALAALAGEGDS